MYVWPERTIKFHDLKTTPVTCIKRNIWKYGVFIALKWCKDVYLLQCFISLIPCWIISFVYTKCWRKLVFVLINVELDVQFIIMDFSCLCFFVESTLIIICIIWQLEKHFTRSDADIQIRHIIWVAFYWCMAIHFRYHRHIACHMQSFQVIKVDSTLIISRYGIEEIIYFWYEDSALYSKI